MCEVIAFPSVRSCFLCAHYDYDHSRCRLFDEPIDSELFAARDCAGYEPQ